MALLALVGVAVVIYLACFLFYHLYYKRLGLPPGPTPLPFIGNFLTLLRHAPGEDAFIKWRYQYGPVYTYWLAHMPVICVAEHSKMVELFQKDGETYAGRLDFLDMEQIAKEAGTGVDMSWIFKLGIFSTDGDWWKEHRRFTVQTLRELGVGRAEVEELILTEISSLITRLNKAIDAGVVEHDLCGEADLALGSVINRILFGFSFDSTNEHEFRLTKTALNGFYEGMADPRLAILLGKSWLLNQLPGFVKAMQRIESTNVEYKARLEAQIDKHIAEMAAAGPDDSPPRDYVTAYLRERAKREAVGDEHTFRLEQLKGECYEMWFAGSDDPQNNFNWGMAHALNLPGKDLQPLYDELDAVVGSDRLVTMGDKQSLPVVSSFLMETLRIANTVPANMLHRMTRDVVVDGYTLKKDTAVVPQLSAVLYDPHIFPNPKRFDPLRFIDGEGRLKRCDELLPFGIGKRQCLGEGLARMELFLLFANLFNQFRITSGSKPPSTKRNLGLATKYTPFKCRIERRVPKPAAD